MENSQIRETGLGDRVRSPLVGGRTGSLKGMQVRVLPAPPRIPFSEFVSELPPFFARVRPIFGAGRVSVNIRYSGIGALRRLVSGLQESLS